MPALAPFGRCRRRREKHAAPAFGHFSGRSASGVLRGVAANLPANSFGPHSSVGAASRKSQILRPRCSTPFASLLACQLSAGLRPCTPRNLHRQRGAQTPGLVEESRRGRGTSAAAAAAPLWSQPAIARSARRTKPWAHDIIHPGRALPARHAVRSQRRARRELCPSHMRWLTAREAARLLHLKSRAVLDLIEDGRLYAEFVEERWQVCPNCTHRLAEIRLRIRQLWKQQWLTARTCGHDQTRPPREPTLSAAASSLDEPRLTQKTDVPPVAMRQPSVAHPPVRPRAAEETRAPSAPRRRPRSHPQPAQ